MSNPAAGYTRLSQDGISIENQKALIRDNYRKHDLESASPAGPPSNSNS